MGMFYTPKPRRFDYQPRFYDPKKEELEKARRRYAGANASDTVSDKDLEYYKSVVESFDEDGKKTKSRTGIFHRKELPTFNYKPRFSGNQADAAAGTVPEEQSYSKKLKFRKSWLAKRNSMDLEPVPASKVFLYAIVVSLLLLWIFL